MADTSTPDPDETVVVHWFASDGVKQEVEMPLRVLEEHQIRADRRSETVSEDADGNITRRDSLD